uniref:Uncharacterized protein n=1 Tax=Tanacetum cinerariifolium TaxID=118510 RepID=A0A6L2JNH5_TANCI|nr:hypothetical protein [Tanacetum cinerariifolium]
MGSGGLILPANGDEYVLKGPELFDESNSESQWLFAHCLKVWAFRGSRRIETPQSREKRNKLSKMVLLVVSKIIIITWAYAFIASAILDVAFSMVMWDASK